MTNSENNPFAGLPVSLVKDILDKSGHIANDIYEPFREITNNRDKLREQLKQHDIINADLSGEGLEIPTSCCIDGYHTVEKFLTSDLACSAAFAVEGLVPPSGKKHWEQPSHQALFHTEKKNAYTAQILRAIMMEMVVELAAKAPHDCILYNGSFITPFCSIMETLRFALGTKGSKISQEFIKRIKTSIVSLQTIFGQTNAQKMWIGIINNSSKNELIKKINLPQHFDDRILFTILLSPGEFTTPLPVDQSELVRVKNLPINDEKFAAVRDSLVSTISKLHILYYRPYDWTPVLRIEISPSAAQDSSKLALLLTSLKFQCMSSGIKEPYPVYRAKKIANCLERAIPSLRKSAISHITNAYKDDLGDLFPLLMFNE